MKKIRELKSRLKAKVNNIFDSDSEPSRPSTPTSAHDLRESASPPLEHALSHSTHQDTELAELIVHSASVPNLGVPSAVPETASPETSVLPGALISNMLSPSQPNLVIEAETLPSRQMSPLPLPDPVQSQLAVVPAPLTTDPDTITVLVNQTELISPHSAPTVNKVPTPQLGISSWAKSEGWANLKGCLSTLNQAVGLSGLGPLKTVIEGMADCIGIYETEAQGRQAYTDLQEELERIFKRMQQYLDLSPTVSANISDVCRMIDQEIEYVKNRQSRTRIRRLAEAEQDDNVLACYRHICDRLHDLSLDMTISTLATVEQHAIDDRMKQLAPAISARYNSGIAHTLKRGPCTEGTRTKVLNDMYRWVADPNAGNIYWISGMAGTGKTTIAYSLCKWLDAESSATLGSSFFCSRSVPECRNIGKIIPSIAYQLAQHSQPFRYALCEKIRSSPDALDGPPALQFESFIVGLVTHPKVREALPRDIVVVIDALDECEDTTSTQQILDTLSIKSRGLPIKFVISSRPEAAIRDQMEKNGTWADSRVVLHELDTGEVQTDIRTYLKAGLAPITPSESVIEKLIERAGVLFIYAATVIRYVGRDNFKGNPRARLQTILNSSSKQSKAQTKDIDELYRTILESAMNNEELETTEQEDIKLILNTVVCAKTPLTVDALNGLLDLGDVERVKAALRPLWSVLHVMGQDMTVSTLHASFSDYLIDSSRSGNSEWHCNDTAHHHILTQRCFECIRDTRPHFNICRLESSYLKDDEVEDFDLRVQKYIPEKLRYACQYWSAHLVASSSGDALVLLLLLEDLLAKRLLLWIEVLNLTKITATSAYSLTIAKEWVARHSTSRELVDLIQDAWRFAFTVASSPISQSTPHIYISMLPFLASDSPIRKHYNPRMNGMIHVEGRGLTKIMDIVDEHPDFIYSLILDDEVDTTANRKHRLRIALSLGSLYLLGTTLRDRIRNPSRRYLTRSNLQPEPRIASSWQALYQSRDDRGYITTMGVNVATFDYMLDSGFRAAWNSRTIPRGDVNSQGLTRLGRRSLDAEGALGLLLHFLSGTMNETSLQEMFALVPSVLSRYIEFALGILLNVLKTIREARISWPTPAKMQKYSQVINDRHPNIVGAFGFLDGLSLPVSTSSDPEIEQATYNGWLHSHRTTNVIVFAPDGCIISSRINAPGSWHDSRTASHVYDQLRNKTPEGFFLVADTAFPRTSADLAGKIKTPLKVRARLSDNPVRAAEELAYSNAITSARQPAEWGMRALQGAYGRLRMPLDINNPIGRRVLLETCFRLHNLRTRLIGINQIRTVYMRQWDSDDDRFLHNLHSMFFSDIRANDRVKRFYLQLAPVPIQR
ncbi:Cytoplasmic dynein 2 heavy chain 1 [Rhizoctonia solani]|uniref:Cytoplasmic dynein 2 heavy chain 1 n=1 Tax=Rhizoctonia solani TaxID=456999 RepID=A0A0K6FZE5_9AGAM|nr:Cytoplasmic dynein 2 heavy chain 1 [Rhizoctonia solani]